MTTMKHCPSLRSVAVFGVWLLASFFSHKLAKMAIEKYASYFRPSIDDRQSLLQHVHTTVTLAPFVVTLCQLLCCLATVSLKTRIDALYVVTVTSHVLGTLATNISLSMTWATSTLAVKMLEPLSSALLQRLLLASKLPPHTALSTLLVVTGAALYVAPIPWREEDTESGEVVKAATMAMLSNVTLGVRNVAIKLAQSHADLLSRDQGHTQPVLQLRGVKIIGGVAVVGLVTIMVSATVVSPTAWLVLALSLGSGVFHVVYSYVSTNVVLRYMSVLNHALLNIIKRVLVVLLLQASGRRQTSLWNWTGLVLCAAGLAWYQRRRITMHRDVKALPESTEHNSTEPSASKQHRSNATTAYLRCILIVLLVPYLACMISADARTSQTKTLRSNFVNMTANRILNNESKVPASTRPKVLNYAQQLSGGLKMWRDGKPLVGHVAFQPEKKVTDDKEFLSRRLLETPFDTDALSPYLSDTRQVIAEAKRVHFNLFRDLLAGKKYAILFGMATFENKGDPAISVGELSFLEELNIRLLYYLTMNTCNGDNTKTAVKRARKYPRDEVVILMSGGGNLIGYGGENHCRKLAIDNFRGYQMVILSQSFYMRGGKDTVQKYIDMYCCNKQLTILLRDRRSLLIAQKMFHNGTRLLLAPDMAFENGPISRFVPPSRDVLWLYRTDGEKPGYANTPRFPDNISVERVEWYNVPSLPSKNGVMKAVNVLLNGYQILLRGKVVITERLHGHILSVLLDIPHVLIDNGDHKLSSYHNTWTRGLSNCRLTNSSTEAVKLALELLETYSDSLPQRLTAVDIV